MTITSRLRAAAWVAVASMLWAQAPPNPGAAPAPQPGQATAAQPNPPAQPPPAAVEGTFQLQNVSLVELIDILARRLKINYILDPKVAGKVTINTYGEMRTTDLRQLLETILRINGFAMVQVGNIFRIVPAGEVSRLPLRPEINATEFGDDERMVLNLIFLKYATVGEISKLIKPFLGEGATDSAYNPANLLLLLDNARNMRRTMELIALFDSETFASQRVRLYEVEHGRPSEVAKELESVFSALALSEKNTSVRFMPIDRINTIIALAPNPGIFTDVEKWLAKL
ncbi:MAG: hypothetical protein FJW37_12180, partial [Acidobacteria bacterium]|nr:hypothetical protein [Acidobacteriota bacterium]